MADIFAPKVKTEVGYEQPITERQTPDPFAGFLQDIGSMFTPKRRGTATSDVDPNLAVFRQDLETLEQVRQERGMQAANIFERDIAKKFAMQGISFDKDYQNVYEKTTGRSWAGYGRDTQSYMIEESLKDPEVQQNYLASFVTLPTNATEEDRINFAIGSKAELEASRLVIDRAKAGGQKQWTLKAEAAYGDVIQKWTEQNLGALFSMQKSGIPIGPQNIMNTIAQWSQVKVSLSRPPQITDEQWKATQDKINNIDGMLATFEKATSSKVALEQLVTGLVNQIEQQEDGDTVSSAITKLTLLKDPSLFANFAQDKTFEVLGNLAKSKDSAFKVPSVQLFNTMSDAAGGSVPTGDTIVPEYPPEIKDVFDNMSAQEVVDTCKAGQSLCSIVKPNDLNKPEAREQFANAANGIGLTLSRNKEGDMLSASFLKELIGNPGFIQGVKTLEALDPETGVIVKSTINTGIAAERVRHESNLASIERSIPAVSWNGTNYVFNGEGLLQESRATRNEINAFTKSLNKHYNGNLEAAARNKYLRMRDVMGGFAVATGLYFVSEALDRREAISVLERVKSELSGAEEQPTAEGIPTPMPRPDDLDQTVDVPMPQPRPDDLAAPEEDRVLPLFVPEDVQQDTGFMSSVDRVSKNLGIPSDELLRAMHFETGGTFNPSIKNPTGSATGLIQFIESTAESLGTSTAELAKMTREEQMEYVEKYLTPYKGRMKDFGDIYMAIHLPVAVGKSDDYVIYDNKSLRTRAYKQNRGLDTNNDGKVTKGEAVARAGRDTK